MHTVLEQGSIDKPLTFDVGLIQLSFIPVCSLNTCNISVKIVPRVCTSVLFITYVFEQCTVYAQSGLSLLTIGQFPCKISYGQLEIIFTAPVGWLIDHKCLIAYIISQCKRYLFLYTAPLLYISTTHIL